MAKDRTAKPTPVVVVKENEPIVATDVMADVVTTLPKTLQEKGSQLVSRLKTTKWNDRGELLHEGVAIPGSCCCCRLLFMISGFVSAAS